MCKKLKIQSTICLDILIIALLIMLPGCSCVTKSDNIESSPVTIPYDQSITCAPTTVQPLPGSVTFRSDINYLSVQLPEGWAAVEGPGYLGMQHIEGIVSFNSWGQSDFWARALYKEGTASDNYTASITYSGSIVASQVPKEGAYVALTLVSGPPPDFDGYPLQYPCNDLSGLLSPHDWRKPPASSATFLNFYKWGRSFTLEVYCHPEASDETVDKLNQLLMSWRFDSNWVGDIEWAGTLARLLLPEEVKPWMFPIRSSQQYDLGDIRTASAEVSDTTVQFRFTYCPGETSCHWWEIDVPPTGIPVLTGEGGAPLPE
jgi:hypothetical protein